VHAVLRWHLREPQTNSFYSGVSLKSKQKCQQRFQLGRKRKKEIKTFADEELHSKLMSILSSSHQSRPTTVRLMVLSHMFT